MANLIYIDRVNSIERIAFIEKLNRIANFLKVDPNWLMQVMYSESRINPKAQNKQNGRLVAAGIIQWTKASGVPGAPASILNLNLMQQLDLMQSYYLPFRGKMKSYFDVYLVTFFPAAMGKPDDYVFQTKRYSAGLIAAQNAALNINKDDKVTMAEFKEYVKKTVPKALHSIVFNMKAATGLGAIAAIGFFF